MGLFFRRNKNKDKKNYSDDKLENKSAYLADPAVEADMVSIIKKEQAIDSSELIFDDSDNDENLSVAKRYGKKYVSTSKGQLASSIVVDVRSYVKPEEKPVENKKFDFEKDLDDVDASAVEKPKGSFFDELLKSLEEDDDDEPEEKSINDEVEEPKQEIKKSAIKPKTQKTDRKKKKSIDIDIISGDFGGFDII